MRLGRLLTTVVSAGALAALAASVAPEARAERIRLKNGHDIKECWILEESKAEIVIAVIRGGNIGKITLDPANVFEIDRNRESSIEEALMKARKALEEEARKREAERAAAAAIAATRTAQPAGGAAGAGAGTGAAGGASVQPGSKLANLVGPTTPEEDEKIAKAIEGIGDTRNQGGAGTRRENALKELVSVGPKALGAINKALSDEVAYRRQNAARAVAEIAKADGRIGLYEEVAPSLIQLLYQGQPWVRKFANLALEAIAGQSMGFPAEPKGEELGPDELAAIDKWGKWWEAQKLVISAQ